MDGGSGLKRMGEAVAPGIPPVLTKCRELAPPIILPPRAKKSGAIFITPVVTSYEHSSPCASRDLYKIGCAKNAI